MEVWNETNFAALDTGAATQELLRPAKTWPLADEHLGKLGLEIQDAATCASSQQEGYIGHGIMLVLLLCKSQHLSLHQKQKKVFSRGNRHWIIVATSLLLCVNLNQSSVSNLTHKIWEILLPIAWLWGTIDLLLLTPDNRKKIITSFTFSIFLFLYCSIAWEQRKRLQL